MKPTKEQQEIIDTFKTARVLKVNAVAGSGKSSTLRLLAEHNAVPSLYVCFNKIIQQEAETKFPEHVACKTTHSMAYAKYGKLLQRKLAPSSKAIRSKDIAQYYNVKDFECNESSILAITVASLARDTVNRYQNSSDEVLSNIHLPHYEIKELKVNHPELNTKSFSLVVLKLANSIWNDRCDPLSDVGATHDTYLKMYQLSKPILNYEILYVDEAQDSNPAVLDIINSQTQCKIVYVGDKFQSIYGFRGAVNAMNIIDAPTRVLSKSFRYGQSIANVASMIISDEIFVKGHENINSVVGEFKQKNYTKVFRTNGALLEEAVDLVQQGLDVYCEVNTEDFIRKLSSIDGLRKHNKLKYMHPEIAVFSTWEDLLEASKEDPELKRLVRIVKEKKVDLFINALKSLTSKSTANITLITAHKSKGCEYDNVIIADDYPLTEDENPVINMSEQEKNLLYVACTRAILKLQLPNKLMYYFEEYMNARN